MYPNPRTFTDFPAISLRPSPYDSRNSQLSDLVIVSSQGPATPPPQSTRLSVLIDEELSELPSEENFAKMSAGSDEALAEIDWLSDPLLGNDVDLSNILSIESSSALVEDFELDFWSSAQGKNRVPDPNQEMQLQDEAEHKSTDLLVQQGTKRKDDDDGNGDFDRVQVDERQVRHPVKRKRLLHGSNTPSDQEASNPNAAFSSRQQWQYRAPRTEENHSINQEQSLEGPTLSRAYPLAQASVEQNFLPTGGNLHEERNEAIVEQPRAFHSARQLSVASPFIPTVATGVQTPDIDIWKFLRIDPADTRSHGNFEAGQTLEDPSTMSLSGYASQSPISQPTALPSRSRTDRGRPMGTEFDDGLQDGQIMRRTSGTFPSRPAVQPSVSQPAAISSWSRVDCWGAADTSFDDSLHAGDILSPTSATFPSAPTPQPPKSQTLMTLPTSRDERSHTRENHRYRAWGYRPNPYAVSQ